MATELGDERFGLTGQIEAAVELRNGITKRHKSIGLLNGFIYTVLIAKPGSGL